MIPKLEPDQLEYILDALLASWQCLSDKAIESDPFKIELLEKLVRTSRFPPHSAFQDYLETVLDRDLWAEQQGC